ncbi:MAG: single-stranded DNA-binding protein, partial [Alphaproteobacteria bacterium]|nr:single-stranded DNA-binding protein [Alphaproteobacteria bacterium]
RYSTEVVLQRFRGELTMLDGRGGGGGGGGESAGGVDYDNGPSAAKGGGGGGGPSGAPSRGDLDDEIPF